jgi:hypothetical protein
VGFLFSKKAKLVCAFLENKKDKILAKNLGFYACSGFFCGTHEVNPSFSEKKPYNFLIVWVLLLLFRVTL